MAALRSDCYPLERRDVVRALLEDRGDLLVVTGLGAPSWDAAAAGDADTTFALWGAMGGAAMVGLGLALAQPNRRVLVITGDGELLMGLGSLATVAVQHPANLAIAVLDNERYGETGQQETHTAHDVDLAGVALASGFAAAESVAEPEHLAAALRRCREGEGPVMVVFKVRADEPPLVMPPKDGVVLKSRFRRALLGPEAEA